MSVSIIVLKARNRQTGLTSSPPGGAAIKEVERRLQKLILEMLVSFSSEPAHTALETGKV